MNPRLARVLAAIAAPMPAAERECAGCARPSHEVGVLTPCRVTCSSGKRLTVSYCERCLEEFGRAPHENAHIASIERLTPAMAMPRTMDEADILAEYTGSNDRVVAEGPTS